MFIFNFNLYTNHHGNVSFLFSCNVSVICLTEVAGEHQQGMTDQWRVYQECVERLSSDQPLRMMIQASAGTGKSYLLESLFLWCQVHGGMPQACAPTGIAAARIFVPRTNVRASTVHHLFQLSVDLESKIDPGNSKHAGTEKLLKMTFLIIDEASMLDDDAWRAIRDQLSAISHRDLQEADIDGKDHPRRDVFGRCHIMLCCDYKQLPPATARPPFIATDPEFIAAFDFRVLRQNRRLAPASNPSEQVALDLFHAVLEDVAHCKPSVPVRKHIVDAYVRGAKRPTANYLWRDEGTACFTKRKYRDRWNKRIQERAADKYRRSLKVDAIFTAANNPERILGSRATKTIKRVVRNQCPVTLHLAGQWHTDDPAPMETKPYCSGTTPKKLRKKISQDANFENVDENHVSRSWQ